MTSTLEEEKNESNVIGAYTTVVSYMAHGGVLKDLQGLSDKNMEAIYAVAHNLYSATKYEQANTLFQYLCMLNPYEKKYWLGLGACRQMQRDFQNAIDAYCMATALDMKDPNAPLHAGECFLALGNLDSAEKSFDTVIAWSEEGGDQYDKLRDRAKGLKSIIEKMKL